MDASNDTVGEVPATKIVRLQFPAGHVGYATLRRRPPQGIAGSRL
jgi:hypothetical protein